MQKPPNLNDLAYDVLMDKYGDGRTRELLLGDLYIPVQKRINEIYRLTSGATDIWCDSYRKQRGYNNGNF